MEFEWNNFPQFTALELVREFQKLMSKMGGPEQFQGRITFMSMFNDITWRTKGNETECIANSTLVSVFAKRFPAGCWSFLGPSSETKWYSTDKERPGGKWDRVAELMMVRFGESGHPVFRATSPFSRGTLKSKGGRKLFIHFSADGDTIETVFRTIFSVNQLSIYGAVSHLCAEYSICQTSTGRPVVAEQIRPTFRASRLIDNDTHTLDWNSCIAKYIAEAQRTSGKALTTRSIDKSLPLMQDSWKQLKSDKTSWQNILTSS